MKFLLGFFTDVNGEPSSTRISLYFCLFLLYMEVKHSLNGATVNQDVLYVIGFVIISLVAGSKAEHFSKHFNTKKNVKKDERGDTDLTGA